MGWDVRWVSSSDDSFNYDFHVTADLAVALVEYNYKDQAQLEAEKSPGAAGQASNPA